MHIKPKVFKNINLNRIRALGLIIPLMGSAAGCGASSAEMPTEVSEKVPGVAAVNLSYEVPVQRPNVMVDQVGYETDSEKTVVFRGEDLPKSFYVCDLESGNVVYRW